MRSAADSVPTSVAVFWAEEIRRRVLPDAWAAGLSVEDYVATKAPAELLLQALSTASAKLETDFGTWNALGRD